MPAVVPLTGLGLGRRGPALGGNQAKVLAALADVPVNTRPTFLTEKVKRLPGEGRWEVMRYRCVATSVAGFLQQLTVSYLARGYWFYVMGCVPEGKDPEGVDARLVEKYGIDVSRSTRVRRKKAGLANVHYIRRGRFFVLLATHGRHAFFEQEAALIRDARRRPIVYWAYSVSYRNGHAHVRLQQEDYAVLKARMLDRALHPDPDRLWSAFRSLPYEPYAPVRRQLLNIHRAVNRRRRTAGLPLVPVTCIRMRRRICRPFEAEALPYDAQRGSDADDGA